jgi:hypothetical protein
MIGFCGSGFDVAEMKDNIEYPAARTLTHAGEDFVDRRGRTRAFFTMERFRRLLVYWHFNFMLRHERPGEDCERCRFE